MFKSHSKSGHCLPFANQTCPVFGSTLYFVTKNSLWPPSFHGSSIFLSSDFFDSDLGRNPFRQETLNYKWLPDMNLSWTGTLSYLRLAPWAFYVRAEICQNLLSKFSLWQSLPLEKCQSKTKIAEWNKVNLTPEVCYVLLLQYWAALFQISAWRFFSFLLWR